MGDSAYRHGLQTKMFKLWAFSYGSQKDYREELSRVY